MNITLLVWAAVLALWTIASVAYYFYLQSVEKVVKKRNTDSFTLARNLRKKETHLKEREEVLNREKENWDDVQLNFRSREKTVLELELTLTNKEAELVKREAELYKKELEIETNKAKKSKAKAE
jgi:hypothetical protein